MKHIQLPSPTGLSGRFVVTRPGDQLSGELKPGEEIALEDLNGLLWVYAKVADLWVGDLALVPGSLLEMEQNPLHRTYSGLVTGLRGLLVLAGESDKIGPFSRVTVLILDFTRNPLIESR